MKFFKIFCDFYIKRIFLLICLVLINTSYTFCAFESLQNVKTFAEFENLEMRTSNLVTKLKKHSFSNVKLIVENAVNQEFLREIQKIKHCTNIEIISSQRNFDINIIFQNLKFKNLNKIIIRSNFPFKIPDFSKFKCEVLQLNAPNYFEDTYSALPIIKSQITIGYTKNTILPKVLQSDRIQFECLTYFYFEEYDSLGIFETSEEFFDNSIGFQIDIDTNNYIPFFDSFKQKHKGKRIEFWALPMKEIDCKNIIYDTIIINFLKVTTLTLSNLQSKNFQFIGNQRFPIGKIKLMKPNTTITSLCLSSINMGELPIDLTQFTNLRELTLDNCTFTNLSIDWKKIKNLRKLNIYSLKISQNQYNQLMKDALNANIKLKITQHPLVYPN